MVWYRAFRFSSSLKGNQRHTFTIFFFFFFPLQWGEIILLHPFLIHGLSCLLWIVLLGILQKADLGFHINLMNIFSFPSRTAHSRGKYLLLLVLLAMRFIVLAHKDSWSSVVHSFLKLYIRSVTVLPVTYNCKTEDKSLQCNSRHFLNTLRDKDPKTDL